MRPAVGLEPSGALAYAPGPGGCGLFIDAVYIPAGYSSTATPLPSSHSARRCPFARMVWSKLVSICRLRDLIWSTTMSWWSSELVSNADIGEDQKGSPSFSGRALRL